MLTLDEVISHFPEPKIRAGNDYRLICPYHDDKNPSLFLSITKHIFHCFGCGKKGTIYDLADFFGIEYEVVRHENLITSAESYKILMNEYGLTKDTIDLFKIEAIEDKQAWRYPVEGGYRYKSFQRASSLRKYWGDKHIKNQIYGLNQAVALINSLKQDRTLYIVNGEPAVWANIQANIPAVCKFGEESTLPSDAPQKFKFKYGIEQVCIIYDKDPAGERGAENLYIQLKKVYKHADSTHVLLLPNDLPPKADTNDLYKAVGFDNEKYRQTIFSLPENIEVKKVKRDYTPAVVDLVDDLGIDKLIVYRTTPPEYFLVIRGRKEPVQIDSLALETASAFQRVYREATDEVITLNKDSYRTLLDYLLHEKKEVLDVELGDENDTIFETIKEIIRSMGEVESLKDIGHDRKFYSVKDDGFVFKQSYLTRKLRDITGKAINQNKLGVIYHKLGIKKTRFEDLRYLVIPKSKITKEKAEGKSEAVITVSQKQFDIADISNITDITEENDEF